MCIGVGKMSTFSGKEIPGLILCSSHLRRLLPTLDVFNGLSGHYKVMSDIIVRLNGAVAKV